MQVGLKPGLGPALPKLGWGDRQQTVTEAEGPVSMPQRVCGCVGGD